MNKIGIMQGRLTPPSKENIIQEFPKNWQREFELIHDLNIDYIEWVFDIIGNPIYNFNINNYYKLRIVKNKNICVCADYFMKNGLIKYKHNLMYLLTNMSFLNINFLTLPLMNITDLLYAKQYKILFQQISVKYPKIKIGLELDLDWEESLTILDRLDNQNVGITYDIGNNGHKNVVKDLILLLEAGKLFHIHIKEKDKNGNSVALTKGLISKNKWKNIFITLKNFKYNGNYTLQLARGKSGEEYQLIQQQYEQIKKWLV